MFLDEAIITVKGGDGGRGCVSWRREKYVPKGGPDGGDGGRGGSVCIIADDDTDTLSDFASRKFFEAQRGEHGKGKSKNGKAGSDLVLRVPAGTLVYVKNLNGFTLMADLKNDSDKVLAIKGGKGGFGNAHFKSSIRQRPDFAELGEPGEKITLKLELKLVADIGIIGYPSTGKSTLISVISSAKPKIADYPFTTIVPNLGVVNVSGRSYRVCDVPGLIEGASKGKGLGDKFLKHIERCGILIHLLDIGRAAEDGLSANAKRLKKDYIAIRKELTSYSDVLPKKKEIVVLNKIDLIGNDAKQIEKQLKKEGIKVFMSISAAARLNTDKLAKKLLPMVLKEREKRTADGESEAQSVPVLHPNLNSDKMYAYTLNKRLDGSILVSGKRIEQFAKMTNFSQEGAVRRFKDVVERIGLRRALEREGIGSGSRVFIGSVSVEKHIIE